MSSHWTSTTNFAWGNGGYNDLNYFYQTWLTDSTIQRRTDVFAPDKTGRSHIQQNFTGDFEIAHMRNRLVIGADYMTQYRNYKYNSVVMDTVNILAASLPDIRKQTLDNKLGQLTAAPYHLGLKTYAAYFSDLLNLTSRLRIMASLRVDHLTNAGTTNVLTGKTSGGYEQTSLAPKLGVVFMPVPDKVSLFANYMTGFVNQADAPVQTNGEIVGSKPKYGNQWEGGVKLDVLNNKLSATVSYYTIAVSNAQRLEQTSAGNFYHFDGTQKSKGVEAEIIGHPLPGFNLISGYGYNDNKYVKADASLVGKRYTGTPRHSGNFWGSYTLLKGKAKGLGLGAGIIYVSEAFANAANTFSMPAYTVIDATLFYDTPRFRLSCKANNITGRHYRASDGYYSHPQATANFLAAVSYRF